MCRVEAIHQRMEIQVDVVRRKGRLGRRRGKLSTEWQLWLLDPLRVKLGPVYLTSTGQSEKCQPSCLNLGSFSSQRDRVTVHMSTCAFDVCAYGTRVFIMIRNFQTIYQSIMNYCLNYLINMGLHMFQ